MSSQTFPQSAKPATTLAKQSNIKEDLLNCFRSVHLAILLLSLLAIGTIIGVVMPQEGMVDIADIQEKFGTNFKFYQSMGFFNVYSSFWFITLQVLFFFNLLIGSFKWLKPATLAAVQKYCLSPELILQKPEVHSLPSLSTMPKDQLETKIADTLKHFHYRIYRDGTGNLYASKGNITRLGPCIAHLGILLCLIAGFYSCLTGFKAIKMAVPGQTFSILQADSFKTNVPKSLWLGDVPKWKIHVNDFQVEFYKDHPETAKQYYSTIQVVSPAGKVIKTQTISVNNPLLYDNLSIYQASYAPTGRFLIQVNGKSMAAEINNQFNQRPISLTPLGDGSTLVMFPFFAAQDPGVTKNYAVFFIRRPGEPFAQGRMPENIRLEEGQTATLKGKTITYKRPEMSTGLQIKRALEVPLMYLSYMIIIIGAVLCFFSQRQLWVTLREVSPGKTEILLHPKTNKARFSFRDELFQIQQALNTLVSPQKHSKELS